MSIYRQWPPGIIASRCILAMSLLSPSLMAQWYVVDVDPTTPGIQTSFVTEVGAGSFAVDVYMLSPGDGSDLFSAVALALEYNDVADCGSPVLNWDGSTKLDPSDNGICDGVILGSCTPSLPVVYDVFASPSVPTGSNATLTPGGYAPFAEGSALPFCDSDGGTAFEYTIEPFFSTGLPANGTPILLTSTSFTPNASGTSAIAPIGLFPCTNQGTPGFPCDDYFTGVLDLLLDPDFPPSWPYVAELFDDQTTGAMTEAGVVPVASPPSFCSQSICPGTVEVDLLPVELLSFTARVIETDVYLEWLTASELNNAGFEIQQLLQVDKRWPVEDWQTIGFVEGAGTSVDSQSYRFMVRNVDFGTTYFRLRQIDLDGTASHSGQLEVSVTLAGTHLLDNAYPNPFNPSTSISISVAEPQHVSIDVFDLTGRVIRQLHEGHLEGNQKHTFTFDARGLPSGIYLYRATGDTFTETRQMVLVK